MNKNSLLAFVLIAITVIFFNSDLWNYKILGRERPVPVSPNSQSQQANKKTAAPSDNSSDIRVIPPDEQTFISDIDSSADSTGAAVAVPQLTEEIINIETDNLAVSISTKGGRIVSLKTKGYKYSNNVRKSGKDKDNPETDSNWIDLIPAGSVGGAQLSINYGGRNESFDNKFFTLIEHDSSISEKKRWIIIETNSSFGPVRKKFTFVDGSYKIGYTVSGAGIVGGDITLGWIGGIEDSEAAAGGSFTMDKRRVHYSDGYKRVEHIEMSKPETTTETGRFRWAGMSSKYFFIALVAPEVSDDVDIRVEGREIKLPSIDGKQGSTDIDYSIQYKYQANSAELENWIYAGPNKIGELSSHELKFEKALFPVLSWARHIFWAGSWFPPLAELILKVLHFLYGLVMDYGIAIFLLTLLSKVITYPLTRSSNKSMLKMRELQPKIKALQQKYKNGTQAQKLKMNQEIMALYKSEGVNPLNPGCLPMLLQMPIFIALFVVLRKAIELRGATSFLLPWVGDLSLPEAIFYLPFSIPFYGDNVALLPIIMALVTFYQQKQVMSDPNQKAMLYMMPILMLVMFNSFPAGVVFYWTVSSALGVVQQKWLQPKSANNAAGATATVTTSSGTQKVPVKKIGGSGGGSSGGKRKKR